MDGHKHIDIKTHKIHATVKEAMTPLKSSIDGGRFKSILLGTNDLFALVYKGVYPIYLIADA